MEKDPHSTYKWCGRVDRISAEATTSLEHRQLYSGDSSEVLAVPAFVEGEHSATGVVKIQYRDLDGKYHETQQEFRCHLQDANGSGLYMVWFDQLLTKPNDPTPTRITPVLPSWFHK